jgi:hypothetical protein
MEMRVRLTGETTTSILTHALGERGVKVRSIRTSGDEATVEITVPRNVDPSEIIVMCAELDDVALLEFGEDTD